jgi:hypothetical protein
MSESSPTAGPAPGTATGPWLAVVLDVLQGERWRRWLGAAVLVGLWFAVLGFTLNASVSLADLLAWKGTSYTSNYIGVSTPLVKYPGETDDEYKARKAEYDKGVQEFKRRQVWAQYRDGLGLGVGILALLLAGLTWYSVYSLTTALAAIVLDLLFGLRPSAVAAPAPAGPAPAPSGTLALQASVLGARLGQVVNLFVVWFRFFAIVWFLILVLAAVKEAGIGPTTVPTPVAV